MRLLRRWTRSNRLALALLPPALAVCAYAGLNASRLEALPELRPSTQVIEMPSVGTQAGEPTDSVVLAAVARDPFRPDRRRPPGRYQMPGQAAPKPLVTTRTMTPRVQVRLTGTVALSKGGLAVLSSGNGASRLVRVGQDFEGFRLVSVGPGTAKLAGNDTTLVLKTTVDGDGGN